MAPLANSTQTPAHTVDCSIPDCKKQKAGGYKTKKGLTDHMQRWHQAAVDMLSPMATTARTLFLNKENEPSTQGNSGGDVNSPKVVSEGRYQCNKCPEEYLNKNNLDKHIMNEHNKAQAAHKNDKDKGLSAALNDNDMDDEELVQIAEGMDDKVARERINIAELGNMIIVDKIVDSFVDSAFNAMNPGQESEKTKCHECVCKDQVTAFQEKSIEKRDAVIVEKTATITGLMETVKTLKLEASNMKKKVEQSDKLMVAVATKNKEISNLKVQVDTKNKLLANTKGSEHDIVEVAMVKKMQEMPIYSPKHGFVRVTHGK